MGWDGLYVWSHRMSLGIGEVMQMEMEMETEMLCFYPIYDTVYYSIVYVCVSLSQGIVCRCSLTVQLQCDSMQHCLLICKSIALMR